MICMPKNLFNDHFIFGNCTIKLIRSKSCHFIRLSNDGADLFRSLLEVTQEGRIRATSGLQEKSLVLILSLLTMKILDILRNVFQQICQTNRYRNSCTHTSMLWLLRIDIHSPVYFFEEQQGSVFRCPVAQMTL